MKALPALMSLALALCFAQARAADFPGTLKVSVQTADCSGATGVGEAFPISPEESIKRQARMQQIMDARQMALEQLKPIVIQH